MKSIIEWKLQYKPRDHEIATITNQNKKKRSGGDKGWGQEEGEGEYIKG